MAVALPLYASTAKDGTHSPPTPCERRHVGCVTGLCSGPICFIGLPQIRNNIPCETDEEEAWREHNCGAVDGGRTDIATTTRLDQEHKSYEEEEQKRKPSKERPRDDRADSAVCDGFEIKKTLERDYVSEEDFANDGSASTITFLPATRIDMMYFAECCNCSHAPGQLVSHTA